MFGMNQQEVINTINDLNNTKYQEILNAGMSEIMSNCSVVQQEAKLSEFYQEKILIPLVADLIEANNRKITEDIQKYLTK